MPPVNASTSGHNAELFSRFEGLTFVNTYRMVGRVVGEHAKVKLQDFLRAERQEPFKNRAELVSYLDVSQ